MRPIDADALADRLDALAYDDWNQGAIVSWADAFKVAAEMVRDERAVDAVEVVRCKDCKYSSPNGKYGCKCYHYKLYEMHEMSPNDFCSHAERKEDE